MDKAYVKHKLKHNGERAFSLVKWIFFGIILGLVCGLIGAAFYACVHQVTAFRQATPYVLLLLPVGAVLIVFFYRVFHEKKDAGTNLILDAIHSGEVIPLRMSFLIFISTIFSHLCGASVGREGAALQIGGSIGQNVGKLFRLNDNDRNTITMCGMSAVFSALFGTPVAAAFFSMEVVSVGIMHYAALLPCVISSIIARAVAGYFGAPSPFYDLGQLPDFNIPSVLSVALVAVLGGAVSILFILALHGVGALQKRIFKNRYLQAFAGGAVLLLLTYLTGMTAQPYNGAGIEMIRGSFESPAQWYDFLLKILFTAISLSCAYKGGEIIPSFFIGATFGSFFGSLLGLSPALSAAIGMCALFVGVTNCPVTGLLISFELFGIGAWPYFLIATALAYAVSGYYGVYSSQTIVYSKYKSNYINKSTHQ